jgi:hypothetical protein
MMPTMSGSLAGRLARLAQLFNEHSLDLPDGLLDRGCVFRLNGVAYEDTMGRPVSDPIVRMVARGPAAYRFLAQAVRYAVPDAHLQVADVVPAHADGAALATGTATIAGTLRGSGWPFHASAGLAVVTGETGLVREVAVLLDEAHVAAIAEARRG